MLDQRYLKDVLIASELSFDDSKYWFDFQRQKFLHNIDTFYYSVKLLNDFRVDSREPAVLRFRDRFSKLKDSMGYQDSIPFYVEPIGKNLNFLSYGYGKYYTICLECPDYFHIFLAPKVPAGSSGSESQTCEIIVQIRSYMLWMYGVYASFEKSLEYVYGILDMFQLQVDFIQENRVDYAWHSNYLQNPEKFFSIENFYRMRVDRYHGANYHTAKVGSEDYEIDYLSLGNRGGKCFVRIYLKSKEVIEQGYKAFFFKLWLFHGLISRYDLYCYEKAYLRHSWQYVTMARLEFYLAYGSSDSCRRQCRVFLEQYDQTCKVTDAMIRLADELTPKLHLVTNVEYQTMRKGTKSYCLLPVRDNSSRGPAKRVYDYLDNRSLIIRYLTHDILRLVEPSGDTNKSRRDYCGFWKALRAAKLVDMRQAPEDVRLIRIYNRKLNMELMKQMVLHKAVMYGIYAKGINEDTVMKDCMQALLRMNDNDIRNAMRYKQRKIREFNGTEFSDTVSDASARFVLLDPESGIIYDDDSIPSLDFQGEEG